MNKRFRPPVYGNLYYSLTALSNKIEFQLQEIRKNMTSETRANLLDFGCGSRPFKEIVGSLNFNYLGADIASIEQVDIVIEENGTLKLANEKVDVVLSTQVLEHIYDFDFYLKESHRVLKEDAYLLLSTHGHWQFHPDPNDYWRWTSQGLKEVIKRNGFEIISFEGIMNIRSVALQYFQDKTRSKLKFKILITAFTFLIQQLIALNERLSTKKNDDNAIYVVLAKKNSPVL
jgi:SAM-dependent methyltransferase